MVLLEGFLINPLRRREDDSTLTAMFSYAARTTSRDTGEHYEGRVYSNFFSSKMYV